ncbi:SpeB, Arginase/agmatinase/formimionoglutamate hydrolase, arginase family protein [Stappia sp. 22II-S9-Z10]|nr:SpeB, Arginase/agmatinase/formimionoglutamate hydrolase, arginase family protein [Stappia sp. 22II-S9-Z10]
MAHRSFDPFSGGPARAAPMRPDPMRAAHHAGRRQDALPARRHHPDFNAKETRGWKALEKEDALPGTAWAAEQKWALEMGLPGAPSLTDRTIPTFARGELPHFAGINTFLKAPYVENIKDVAKYDAAVLGVPFDSGTTYRPGTRFGPQGIRRISALYTTYNYELGVDLREQMTLCDAGDVFTIPGNLEKSFDQISRGVGHVFASGALPIILGGDHSIGFPCVRGIAENTSKRIGIIHFDRHIDIQEKDLDERMHTTPWYWTTNLPNVPAVNLVQLGIGGWQVPRPGAAEAFRRQTNVLTIEDIEHYGLEKTAEIALELAWKDADAVYISFDVDSLDCGFVPGTGWPEPGGFLPREALKILGLVCAPGICGLEVVEVSPPYDTSDITALMGVRVAVEALGSMCAHGTLGKHKAIIDKPIDYAAG